MAPGQNKTGQSKTQRGKAAAPGVHREAGLGPGPAKSKPPVTQVAAPGQATAGAPGESKTGAESAESKISRVDAQGHVIITNGLDTGRGKFGVYNADTGIATLIGDVVIERGKDVIRGQRGVMDLNNNVSRMMPGGAPGAAPQRVQGLFVRREQGAVSGPAPSPVPGREPAAAAGKRP
jgi:lipopolysaccharide assembly outer membrane protein LptD (OstA)